LSLQTARQQLHDRVLAELATGLQGIVPNARARIAAATNVARGYPTEPDFVAQMVAEIPPLINGVISPLFAQHGVQLVCGGVFIHKSPQVTATFPRPLPAAVEVGDLLAVITHKVSKNIRRRALLLQAKIPKGSPPVTPDNPNQHHLYHVWPNATYVRSRQTLNGRERHPVGSDLHDATKYLLLDVANGFPFWQLFHWPPQLIGPHAIATAHPTLPTLTGFRVLAEELREMLFVSAGKRFDLRNGPPPQQGGWNDLISDLLQVTAKTCFRFAGAAGAKPRGQGVFFLSGAFPPTLHAIASTRRTVSQGAGLDGPPPVMPDDAPRGGNGISVIEIEIIEEEPPEQRA
jgi:hypothetical protein